jgi:hypothetical protein
MAGTSRSMSNLPRNCGILLFSLGHDLIIKVRIMTMGSYVHLDIMYRIVLMLKLVYTFKVVNSFNVVLILNPYETYV